MLDGILKQIHRFLNNAQILRQRKRKLADTATPSETMRHGRERNTLQGFGLNMTKPARRHDVISKDLRIQISAIPGKNRTTADNNIIGQFSEYVNVPGFPCRMTNIGLRKFRPGLGEDHGILLAYPYRIIHTPPLVICIHRIYYKTADVVVHNTFVRRDNRYRRNLFAMIIPDQLHQSHPNLKMLTQEIFKTPIQMVHTVPKAVKRNCRVGTFLQICFVFLQCHDTELRRPGKENVIRLGIKQSVHQCQNIPFAGDTSFLREKNER